MKRVPLVLAALAVAIVGLTVMQASGDDKKDEKPKYTIGEVMETAHDKDSGLLKKVTSGKASDAEKKKLLELYIALSQNRPPKGDVKEFQKKTEPIVAAAKEVVEGKKGAEQKLQKSVNCMGCHKAHRE